VPAPHVSLAPARFALAIARGAFPVPLGGSSPLGALGYARAAVELAPPLTEAFDVVIAPLGSGGTAAGLLAGFAALGVHTQVLGVSVALPAWLARRRAVSLARSTLRLMGRDVPSAELAARLHVDGDARGEGYGHATRAGNEAAAWAHTRKLTLDPTYTAKTLGVALDVLAAPDQRFRGLRLAGRPLRIAYLHTLAADAAELPAAPLPPELARLFSGGAGPYSPESSRTPPA
jgi:1-aminocyclopropane-1-carboxylate deaminase/D-cysteine desulfhydrase-like pyridoxal-dependent ACC family enzyme